MTLSQKEKSKQKILKTILLLKEGYKLNVKKCNKCYQLSYSAQSNRYENWICPYCGKNLAGIKFENKFIEIENKNKK